MAQRLLKVEQIQSFAPVAQRLMKQLSSSGKRRFSFKGLGDSEQDLATASSSSSPVGSPQSDRNARLFHVEEGLDEHDAERDRRTLMDPDRGQGKLESDCEKGIDSQRVQQDTEGVHVRNAWDRTHRIDPEMQAIRNGCRSSSRGSSQESLSGCTQENAKGSEISMIVLKKTWDENAESASLIQRNLKDREPRPCTQRELRAFAKAVPLPLSILSAVTLNQLIALDSSAMRRSQWIALVFSLAGAVTAGMIAVMYAISFRGEEFADDLPTGSPAPEHLLETGSFISFGVYICVVLTYISAMILLSVKSPEKDLIYSMTNTFALCVCYLAVLVPLNKVIVVTPYTGFSKQYASASTIPIVAFVGAGIITGVL